MSHSPLARAARRFAVLALGTLTACGPSFARVAGQVTCDDEPVTSGTVIIVGSNSLPYYGMIADDGTYVVAKVPTGLAKVAVFSPSPNETERIRSILDTAGSPLARPAVPKTLGGDPDKWFPIPEKYSDLDMSGITLTVTRGGNSFDISLVIFKRNCGKQRTGKTADVSQFASWDKQFYPRIGMQGSYLLQIDCDTQIGGLSQ